MGTLSKVCTKCKKDKPLSEYSKERGSPDGLQWRCKKCRHDYYNAHKEHDNKRNNEWYWKNKEVRNTKSNENYQANKEAYTKRTKKRVSKLAQASLGIYEQTRPIIRKIFNNRPSGYSMDHIIPITNTDVCGLHVPWNLQYLPKSKNIQKGTKFNMNDPKQYDELDEPVNDFIKNVLANLTIK